MFLFPPEVRSDTANCVEWFRARKYFFIYNSKEKKKTSWQFVLRHPAEMWEFYKEERISARKPLLSWVPVKRTFSPGPSF